MIITDLPRLRVQHDSKPAGVGCIHSSLLAQAGSRVEEFQKICEVQSDKAAVEITSRYAGLIKQLYHKSGDLVQVLSELPVMHILCPHVLMCSFVQVGSPLVDIEVTDDSSSTEADSVKTEVSTR